MSSVLHDPSEINLKYWFVFLTVEYFCEKIWESLMKIKKTAFI